jgi:Immunity protein 35
MQEIDKKSAEKLAVERVELLAKAANDEFVVMASHTEEVKQGWVFFYNTKEFAQTQSPLNSLAGNGPIYVTRFGIIHLLPTSIPWRKAIEGFERGSKI